MMTLRKFFILIFLGVLLAGCSAQNNPAVLDPKSVIAQREADLFNLLYYMGLAVFFLVAALLLTILIRNRHKTGDATEPAQVHGNIRMEVLWTAGPILLVIFIFITTVQTMSAIAAPAPGPDNMTIKVIGHRWWWEFQYPDNGGIITANEIHIPVGKKILLEVTSADVIHSFWPPQLSGKMDVIPGQINRTWITSDQAGEYSGYCSEFCGEQHANMRFKVIAQSEADFNAWVAGQTQANVKPTSDLELEGEKIVAQGLCAGCHQIEGTNARGQTGPNLTKLYTRTTLGAGVLPMSDDNLRTWLQHSDQVKPLNLMAGIKVTDQQIEAVMAYLKTLK